MEPRAEVLARTRRKINASKAHLNKTWEDLFGKCDVDQSGCLCYAEFEQAVRKALNISDKGICNHDLRMTFNHMDVDRSGGVDIEELLNYLSKGYRTEHEIAARAETRIQRVKRALKLAFSNLSKNEATLRKMFAKMDMDSDAYLSLHEFKHFVRMELKLSFWDLNNGDVEEFYHHLDRNKSGGICINEIINFVKATHETKAKQFSFTALPKAEAGQKLRKKKSFKQILLEPNFRTASLPDLSRMKCTPSIVSQGRGVIPATRSSLTKSSQMFFDPGGPERRLRTGSSGKQ